MVKKILTQVIYPLPLSLQLIVVGLLLMSLTEAQLTGKVMLVAGLGLIIVFSLPVVAEIALRYLEKKHEAIKDTDVNLDIRWVVVLGEGGHRSDPRLPVTGIISNTALARVGEGIRLHRLLPASKMILSGGSVYDPKPTAKVMADVAIALGVDSADMILESDSKDTKDEARFIRSIVEENIFYLVTSAAHMHRSMAIFLRHGMNPIAAPTDFQATKRQRFDIRICFPSPNALTKAEKAFHEFLGMVWGRTKRQL